MNWKEHGQKWPWPNPVIYLEGLKKTTRNPARTTGVPAEIWTQHLPNTSLKRFRYANLLDIIAELRIDPLLSGGFVNSGRC
jgi:hypothetical protein